MSKFMKSAVGCLAGASFSLILLVLPSFIHTTAIADQDVAQLSRLIFLPLFVLGTVISAVYTHKKSKTVLQNIGLLFTGALVILLAFLGVYHLQMLLPLLKTNSVELVVMWIARILGGFVGLFCGFMFGSVLQKGVLQYLFAVLGGVLVFALGTAASAVPYEALFYSIGFLCFAAECISVFKAQKE